jgi:hypothetical protein
VSNGAEWRQQQEIEEFQEFIEWQESQGYRNHENTSEKQNPRVRMLEEHEATLPDAF